jgi:hypothetical protein
MKRLLLVLLAFAALVALPRVAAAQTHPEKSAKADLHLSQPMVVGTATLTPGDYRLQCQEIDGQHYLVVTSSDGEEVTRVPCTPETLTKKADTTEFRTFTLPDGSRQLTSLRIKGEMIAHRVFTPVTS